MPSPAEARRLLGALVSHTARQWRRAVDRDLEPHNLTEATWLPLLHVARAPTPMRQKDLAESLSLDGSSVVRLLDNLQNMGLIERREGTDRRSKAIHLTSVGQATVERVEGISRQVRERVLAEISDDDVVTVFRTLEKICAALPAASREQAA
ncbi:MarR family transcriptional regulator [Bradyrhizobium viridifuturi]|uniref:MarR family winged helix-turn-helix transcriptional regulator n=1 Tax=uncultured Bradyrhizobium sp. TaxID=199684 RepID=UPI001BA87F42|nr:MarR family transcriptional regulator [uncultured Bradyrhizobium sp.]MBR1040604.1 MarR family transcriptional regulator [Bradyrhizobium viridifuturi]MBR1074892.1 MarR family transcriptional regulator [Bradyrhizobium viridifuturi]